MRITLIVGTVTAALCAVPIGAAATPAYSNYAAPIYAGPGTDYPVVGKLARGAVVNVNGCLIDYSWCDVKFGPNRGWVAAADLSSTTYTYQHQPAPLAQYGPQLGLPTLSFFLGDYWDRNYRDRPFYRDRNRWEERQRADRRDYRGPPGRNYSNQEPRGRDYSVDRREAEISNFSQSNDRFARELGGTTERQPGSSFDSSNRGN